MAKYFINKDYVGGYKPYQALGHAVIVQAAKDYKAEIKLLLKHPERKLSDALLYLELFFRSQWFVDLSGMNARYLVKNLWQGTVEEQLEQLAKDLKKDLKVNTNLSYARFELCIRDLITYKLLKEKLYTQSAYKDLFLDFDPITHLSDTTISLLAKALNTSKSTLEQFVEEFDPNILIKAEKSACVATGKPLYLFDICILYSSILTEKY